jgi:hypothetical protein
MLFSGASMCGRSMNFPSGMLAGWLKQWRGTQRYLSIQRPDEDALTRDIVRLTSEHGRYGYGATYPTSICARLRRNKRGWKLRSNPRSHPD